MSASDLEVMLLVDEAINHPTQLTKCLSVHLNRIRCVCSSDTIAGLPGKESNYVSSQLVDVCLCHFEGVKEASQMTIDIYNECLLSVNLESCRRSDDLILLHIAALSVRSYFIHLVMSNKVSHFVAWICNFRRHVSVEVDVRVDRMFNFMTSNVQTQPSSDLDIVLNHLSLRFDVCDDRVHFSLPTR